MWNFVMISACVVCQILAMVSAKTNHDLIEQLIDPVYNKHLKYKVKIRVYYEALCPDSKYFFIYHLGPVSQQLSEFLDISLVPYGYATTIERNGKYYFTCQHGEAECYGNKIHACAIEALKNKGTETVKLIECMIKDNRDPDKALERCAKEMYLDPEPIASCAKSDYGSELLNMYGQVTQLEDPKFIPTIVINGSSDKQAGILKNLLLEVCKVIGMPLPSACL